MPAIKLASLVPQFLRIYLYDNASVNIFPKFIFYTLHIVIKMFTI
jgi:hypothetical protein